MRVRGVLRTSRPNAESARWALTLPLRNKKIIIKTPPYTGDKTVEAVQWADFHQVQDQPFFFLTADLFKVVNPFWYLFHFWTVSQGDPLLPKPFIRFHAPDLLETSRVNHPAIELQIFWNEMAQRRDMMRGWWYNWKQGERTRLIGTKTHLTEWKRNELRKAYYCCFSHFCGG